MTRQEIEVVIHDYLQRQAQLRWRKLLDQVWYDVAQSGCQSPANSR